MSLRVVVLFNLGPPFGGFRAAARVPGSRLPGLLGLDNAAAFEALEQAIQQAFVFLQAHPPDSWRKLASADSFRASVPRLDDREGAIDVTGDATNDAAGEVMLRAFLSFPKWPLGGWAVYEAWHRDLDGVWTPFDEDELAGIW